MESREVAIGDLEFRVRTAGPADGEAVLALHGFPQNGRTWQEVAAPLVAAGYRVIAPDQRGYSPGARPEAVEAYRMEHLVGDALRIAEVCSARRFHVLGHDWGGAVAWHLAARHPSRVLTATSLSTPHPRALADAMRGSWEQRLRFAYALLFAAPASEHLLATAGFAPLRLLLGRGGLPGDVADRYLSALGGPEGLRAALRWYRAAEGASLRGMPPVRVPMQLIWGQHDPALGRAAVDASDEHVEGPYRRVVLDAGHWLPELAAERVAELVLDFMRRG